MSCAETNPIPGAVGGILDRALVGAFLAHVPDFVHFKDRNGRFIAVSASKVRRNGLKHESEILGRTDFDFFSAEDANRAKKDEEEVMRSGRSMAEKLEHVKWADGRETWSLINKMPLRDESGAIIGTFGITKDVTESKKIEIALETSRRELIDASRLAGMAEVATGILHNVGNVLNSLNVSTTVITAGLRHAKTESLAKAAEMLRKNRSDIGSYLNHDPKGKLLPEFIDSLSRHFTETRASLLGESESLQRNVDHIKEIISMQQTYATMVGAVEALDPAVLMEDAARMNSASLVRHDVRVVREFDTVPPVAAEKAKVLQILVNLIRNAKYAADEGGRTDKIISLRIKAGQTGRILLIVEDNGIGIPAENLTRVFNHGFTTKATGHGFGLHSSANAAKEMKGHLSVHSEGSGRGATFTLDLPAAVSSDDAGFSA